jgi:hypothetical protein
MPAGSSVRPKKWENVLDLYDDGEYSAIWGSYDGEPVRCLGVRWNGEGGGVGYPNQGPNPLWHVEPAFLAKGILFALLEKVNFSDPVDKQHLNNILEALRECS